jgi:hypothetical protein
MPNGKNNKIKALWEGYDSSHDKDQTIYRERNRMSLIVVGEELSEGTQKMDKLDTRLTAVEKKIGSAETSVSTTKKILIFVSEVFAVGGVMAGILIPVMKWVINQ